MKSTLAANRFKTHNNKSKELVASKFHSTLRNVRIVINTGIDKNTGQPIKGKAASFKAVFINNQSQWRTIAMGASFQPGSFKSHFGSKLTAIEVGADEASTCKRCGTKNFKAKSGNVVCANACWTGWRGYKAKATKKNTSQNTYAASKKRNAAARKYNRDASKAAAEKKAIAEKVVGTYTTFVPGQLVKVVEPQQNTLSNFIGTVTKVELVPGRPASSKLMDVWVMWMHSGVTDRHHNYRADTGNGHAGTDTYLVPVA